MHTARLQYDRIIITGASSGFGEAFAGTLAPHTAELVLIARNEAALRQLAAALEKRHSGLHASVLPCDLADEASLNMLISRLDSLPPGRTLLINNAGAGDYGDFSDGRWEKIRFLLRLNVESLTRLCHALVPSMKRNGGDIINLSSLGALLPIPDFAVYAATKAYVSSLSEALRLELREHGIRVLVVCPGPVSTGFGKAARRPGFTGNMMPGRNAFDTSVETVVKDSLRALARGRARVFPGMKIRLAAMLLAAAPLGLIRLFMGRRPRKVLPASMILLLQHHESAPPQNTPPHLVQARSLHLPGSHGSLPVHAVPRPDHTRPERGAGTGAAGFRNLSAPEIPPHGTTRTGRTANNRCTIRLRKGTRG